MSILISVLIFGLIVFIHELGHFLLARKAGILVEEFAIGMGPKIIGKQSGDTLYSIRAIPFGGYCKMLGEDEAVDTDGRSYSEKSVWKRFSVIIAGPMFNFILAFVFAIIYLSIVGTTSREVAQVPEELPAYEAGIEVGDVIVGFNNRFIMAPSELRIYLNNEKPDVASITVKRDGEKLTFDMIPQVDDNGIYRIGVAFDIVDTGNILDLVKYAVVEIAYWIRIVIYSLGLLITGGVSGQDVAGPVGLVSAINEGYTDSIQYGFRTVVATLSFYVVLLSSNLGVMNLLPIPALDGGRLVFILIEAVRGKAVDPDKEGRIHFIGYVLLMGLMVLVLFNDITKLFQ